MGRPLEWLGRDELLSHIRKIETIPTMVQEAIDDLQRALKVQECDQLQEMTRQRIRALTKMHRKIVDKCSRD